MGGRIYDASIGRFMQADPFIQAPNNTQNYNRYSYVLNNPMSYTDPSGFNFLKNIGDAFGGLIKGVFTSLASVPIINTAVQVGVGFICGPAAPSCLGAYNTLQTYALTGSLGASLRAGVVSYAGANVGSSEWYQGLSSFGQAAVQVGIDRLGQTPEQSNDQAAYVTQMQTVARTSSNLTGNKFANGAIINSGLSGHADRFELYREREERFEYVRTNDGEEIRAHYSHTVYTENRIDDALSFALSVRGALRANKIDLLDGPSIPTGLAYATTFTYDLPLIRFYEVEVLYRRNLSKPFQAPENRGELSKKYNVWEEFSFRHSNFVGSETSFAYCNDVFGCSRF